MKATGIVAPEDGKPGPPSELCMAKCTCKYCKSKIDPVQAVKHLQQCQPRIQQLESKGKQEAPERARLVCPYCKCKVNAKNMLGHIQQVHLSKDLAAVPIQQPKPSKLAKPKVVMTSKRGTRTVGLRICDKCRVIHMEHWTYHFSDGTSQTVCRFCKGQLLDKAANRKTDTLDRCVPGSAMSGKRQ